MKTLIIAIALTAALAAPVFADSDHDHGNEIKGPGMQGGMMMDQEHMMEMHEHMQEMQKIMADIKQESDPNKHHTLMQKHMESMLQGMGMMKGKYEMKDQIDMSSMPMKGRMGMMEKRMNMMQMMMDQMMQHKAEEKK